MYSKKVGGNIAKACTYNARISVKNTKPVCRAIRGMYLNKAKKFLEDVIKGRRSINGKYYTKSAKEVLKILLSAEKNAEFKNLDLSKLYIIHIAALKGTTIYRRRHKRSLGMKLKTAHLEVILKEKTKLKSYIEKKKEELDSKQNDEVKEIKEEQKVENENIKEKSNKLNTEQDKKSIKNESKETKN